MSTQKTAYDCQSHHKKSRMTNIFESFSILSILIYLQVALSSVGSQEHSLMDQPIQSTNSKIQIKSQFEQPCRGFGRQPCTCYYPDHPNVPIFELSSDEITANASRINGIGPSNCSDLQAIGYSLRGFYVVRLHDKRFKIIYCDFNEMNKNINKDLPASPKNSRNTPVNPEFSQFCKGLQSLPCIALLSDYPDISMIIEIKKNDVGRPTNCEDLASIGYAFKGFYWVAMTANKVRLVFCDFEDQINAMTKITALRNITPIETHTSSRFCNDVGSQPCSCYYTKLSNTLQFELSNDKVTRQASTDKGAGPKSCEELRKIGYTFDGFYMVRFKTNIFKAVYCVFNYSETEDYVSESTTQSTLKTTSIALKATQSPVTKQCDKISRIRHLNEGKCINATLYSSKYLEKLFMLVNCDNNIFSQQWVLRNGSFICTLHDQCLAAKPGKSNPSYMDPAFMPYNQALKSNQQWTIDKNNKIYHSQSGWRLSLSYLIDDRVDLVNKDTLDNKNQNWSFEPILIKGVSKCDD